MNICLDAYAIETLPGTFISGYSEELIKVLSQGEYPHVLHGIFDGKIEKNMENSLSWCIPAPIVLDRKNNNLTPLEDYFKENSIEIFHSLNNGFTLPEKKLVSYVSTIHTLYAAENKELVDEKYYTKFVSLLPKAIENSNKVIAVSNFIKEELIRLFNINEDKIHVIYPLVGREFKPLPTSQCKSYLQNKYGIKDNFIFYCGNLHRSKNLTVIFNIFKYVSVKCRDLKLIIAGNTEGKRAEYYNELETLSSRLEIRDKIIFTGLLPREDMPYFYNRAKCIVNLSEYDGYPLSLCEAALCKTPIICLLTPSVKEVLSGSAVTCTLKKQREIADFITYICSSSEFRKSIINKMEPPLIGSPRDYIDFYNQLQ